jgi:hypothetical protein
VVRFDTPTCLPPATGFVACVDVADAGWRVVFQTLVDDANMVNREPSIRNALLWLRYISLFFSCLLQIGTSYEVAAMKPHEPGGCSLRQFGVDEHVVLILHDFGRRLRPLAAPGEARVGG